MYFCPHLLNLVALANFMVTTYNTSWLQLIWRTKITAVVNFAKNRLLSNSNHKTISTSCISPNDHTLLLFPSCRIRRKVIPPLFRTEFVPFFFFCFLSICEKKEKEKERGWNKDLFRGLCILYISKKHLILHCLRVS